MKNVKAPPFSLLHVLGFDQVVLKEFTGKLAHFLFFGINLASYDRGEHFCFQVERLDEEANSKALNKKLLVCLMNSSLARKRRWEFKNLWVRRRSHTLTHMCMFCF